jgi:hypothetical protein
VAVMVVVSMVMIVGFAALTIDVGYLYNVRGDLQRAVDSAALAGASALVEGADEARTRALGYAAMNDANGDGVTLKSGDVQLGSWNANTRTFTPLSGEAQAFADSCRVTARLNSENGNAVPLFFAGIFGRDTTDVSAYATAQFGTAQTWDVMIVQDNSGSFTDALDLAKDADRALVQCLKDHTDNDSQVGFVTYTGSAMLNVPLQSLDTGFELIMSTIDNLAPCCWWFCGSKPACKTGTNIAAGVDLAVDELLNSSGDPEFGKAIVIVSDGKPQATAWVPYTDEELKDMAIDAVDAAAEADISVFTIYYAGSSSTPALDAEFLEGLVRGDGTYHETADAEELSSVIWKVCASLPLMLVE